DVDEGERQLVEVVTRGRGAGAGHHAANRDLALARPGFGQGYAADRVEHVRDAARAALVESLAGEYADGHRRLHQFLIASPLCTDDDLLDRAAWSRILRVYRYCQTRCHHRQKTQSDCAHDPPRVVSRVLIDATRTTLMRWASPGLQR